MRQFVHIFLFISLIMLGFPAFAGDASDGKQAYFSVLPDVPLMPFMEDMTDQNFVFDKAEGRVIGAVGFLSRQNSRNDSEKKQVDPEKFYTEVLPRLGWKPLKSGVFVRGSEQLAMTITSAPSGIFVKLQLSPLSR